MSQINNNEIIMLEGMLIDFQTESTKTILKVYVNFLNTTLTITSIDKNSLEPYIIKNSLNEAKGTFLEFKLKVIKKQYKTQIRTYYNLLSLKQ